MNWRYKGEKYPEKVSNYLYHLSIRDGYDGGTNATRCLLLPGAWAKKPLINRVSEFQIARSLFIYGENDWMDYRTAIRMKELLKGKNQILHVERVSNSTHQLFRQNPKEFNSKVLSFLLKENYI